MLRLGCALVVLSAVAALAPPAQSAALESTPESVGPQAVRLVANALFEDVSESSTHYSNIEALARLGVFEGTDCGPNQFCPTEPIPRWVMAVWLVRVLDGVDPSAGLSRFTDLPAGSWWAPHVERLAELGVTVGCSTEPLRFCPHDSVTRAQMASFLTRAFGLPPGPVPGAGFVDVAASNTHYANINAIAAAGVTAGCATGPPRYCPQAATTRAQMATFLNRALSGRVNQVDDAILPVTAHQIAAARVAPRKGIFNIPVYLCGEPGRFSQSDLISEVQRLQDEVTPFFSKESSGELTLNFTVGTVVAPSDIAWNTATLKYLWSLAKGREDNNPCGIKARAHAQTSEILVLMDIDPGGTWGYAYYGGGPAFSVTDDWLSAQWFLYTVVHELGHSLLNLCHPHQTSRRSDRYHGECRLSEVVHGNSYSPDDFQFYHDEYIYDPYDASVMSYKFTYSQSERNSYRLRDDFISCRQQYVKQYDVTGCRGAEILDPNYTAEPPKPTGEKPGAPTDLDAAGRDEAIFVKWSPPFDDGGSPLTGYLIAFSYTDSDGAMFSFEASTSNHSYSVGGVMNGITYAITVRAENEIGIGEPATIYITPLEEQPTGTYPGPVTDLRARAGDHQITLHWSPPIDDGGSPITGYYVTYSEADSGVYFRWLHEGTMTTATITGLNPGVEYEIEVTARNINGHSDPSYVRATTSGGRTEPPDPTSCTITGTSGSDVLQGTPGNDVICARSGSDIIYGLGGDDTIYADSGSDTVYGGPGNDVIYGDSGSDILDGGSGNDILNGGSGNDILNGGDGNDTLDGGSGNDILNGGDGNDTLDGGSGNNVLNHGDEDIPNRQVRMLLGDQARNQPGCEGDACYFLEIMIDGFQSGSHYVECWSETGLFFEGQVVFSATQWPDTLTAGPCWYGIEGHRVWVTVDGIQSEVAIFPADIEPLNPICTDFDGNIVDCGI